jgi:stage II sporulation protein D
MLATVAPAEKGQLLTADARPYRGLMEVRPARDRSLTVVNVINVEEYLRGVVPNELSPVAFPEIEAHKAQAVAARTWVLSHLGDYSSKGYDVCATQACQVYRGQGTEQPLTDAAIEETRGVIATWRGRPIHAYYTSTCGGHTEDGVTIFDDRAPYLRGVICAPESSARHRLHTTAEPRRGASESPAGSRSLALLEALDVIGPEPMAIEALGGVATDEEIRGWMGRLHGALQRSGCESPVTGGLARRGSFAEFAVASVCWASPSGAAPGPVAEGEDEPLATDSESTGAEAPVENAEERALALLVREGLLPPGPDGSIEAEADEANHADEAMTRGEALDVLAGLAETIGTPAWRGGALAGFAEGQITVLRGEQAETFALDPDAWLFRSLDGIHAGVSELTLTVGDEVSYVTRDGRVVYLEVPQTRRGAEAVSQSSRYYRWEAQLTPADIAHKIARYGSVGQVRDIVPRRLGVSGRVVELEVQGTTGALLLKGLKVRWGLGLRENLFVIDRETDSLGQVERFVISGKGWGHGVGLCQVGSFGMAQAGSTYEQILKHYYSGIRLGRSTEIGHP